jgi:hypothetical protein
MKQGKAHVKEEEIINIYDWKNINSWNLQCDCEKCP